VQKKILIVEDEYDIASTMTLVLEMENYEIRHCYNGIQALDILASEALPDMIISDIMMPLMDGYGFTKAVRDLKKYDKIPILLTSAAKLDEKRVNIKAIQGFIHKPFDLDTFIGIVEGVLLRKAK
jgi:CheY-like chemotaxis protein